MLHHPRSWFQVGEDLARVMASQVPVNCSCVRLAGRSPAAGEPSSRVKASRRTTNAGEGWLPTLEDTSVLR